MAVPDGGADPRQYSVLVESKGSFAAARDALVGLLPIGFVVPFLLLALNAPRACVIVLLGTLALWGVLALTRLALRAVTRQAPASVSVEKNALVMSIGRKPPRSIKLRMLQSGRVLPSAGGGGRARVVVRGRWGWTIAMSCKDREEARALLRDLQLSARDRPATFRFFFGLRVTVGADGILMEWPLLRRRHFVQYASIVSMRPTPGMIRFELEGGARYEIMTTTSRRSVILEQHDALVERIEDARAAYHADHTDPPLAALARGGRSALEWVKDLRALGETSGSGYRAATLPTDALWSVALDPAATEEMRIGAGLALRVALDDEGRAKLRAAAEASASPRVRVALEAVAGDAEDEEVGDALELRKKRE